MDSRLRKKINESGVKMKKIAELTGKKYKTVNRQCVTGIKTTRVAKPYAAALKCNPLDLIEL